jgi:hypothetical protein
MILIPALFDNSLEEDRGEARRAAGGKDRREADGEVRLLGGPPPEDTTLLVVIPTPDKPQAKRAIAPHCCGFNRRLSITTEKKAVVNSFIWYKSWKIAGSKFEAATYCRLFWRTYIAAGSIKT